jgi:molybdenum cofactor synthesis domain-containing protein
MADDEVEILAIGTELVTGLVLDTNSHWIAGQVSVAGGQVRRISAVPDDLDHVVAELGGALERGVRLVITTGGLGPTEDDLTVEAVSRVAGCGVSTPPAVLENYARRRGVSLAEASTPPRLKMGSIPAAAVLYLNPVGWAPSFAIDVGQTTIWSMPGPPKEVQGCFKAHIAPALERMFASRTARMRVYIDAFESETAPLMQQVRRECPSVYVKAYVGMSRQNGLPVDIVVRGADGEDPDPVLGRAYGLFCAAAREAGKTVTLEPTAPLRDA